MPALYDLFRLCSRCGLLIADGESASRDLEGEWVHDGYTAPYPTCEARLTEELIRCTITLTQLKDERNDHD